MTEDKRQIKRQLRLEMRSKRRQIHSKHGTEYAQAIRTNFIQALNIMPQTIFGAYYPIGAEVNCRPLMDTLHAMGHTIALPIVVEKEEPLIYRMYKSGDQLEKGPFGTPEPVDFMPELVPDVMILPVMGFSAKGYRLGYGTGFFDRTVKKFRMEKPIKVIAVAYSGQEIEDFPVEQHDARCDMVITELGVTKARRRR